MIEAVTITDLIVDSSIETVIETEGAEVLLVASDVVLEVIESAPQGPPGPSAYISSDANNRLSRGSDAGLFVQDDLVPNPLAYYILSKA